MIRLCQTIEACGFLRLLNRVSVSVDIGGSAASSVYVGSSSSALVDSSLSLTVGMLGLSHGHDVSVVQQLDRVKSAQLKH